MRISQKSINKNLEGEIFYLLYQVITDLKNPQETKIFIGDILNKNELTVISKRLAIAYYLENKRSYQNIKDNLKVSSATIASIDKMRKNKGYLLALKKIEADRWATEWAGKIEKWFKGKKNKVSK